MADAKHYRGLLDHRVVGPVRVIISEGILRARHMEPSHVVITELSTMHQKGNASNVLDVQGDLKGGTVKLVPVLL